MLMILIFAFGLKDFQASRFPHFQRHRCGWQRRTNSQVPTQSLSQRTQGSNKSQRALAATLLRILCCREGLTRSEPEVSDTPQTNEHVRLFGVWGSISQLFYWVLSWRSLEMILGHVALSCSILASMEPYGPLPDQVP